MVVSLIAALALMSGAQETPAATQGQLAVTRPDGTVTGLCPLKNTDVHATISGFGARVHVVQTFTNPSDTPIEAVYIFPLSDKAAVDSLRIQTGNRVIEGTIKRREEARMIYEQAKAQGQTAALLDQERPNIFTQRIANVMPHEEVKVDISYAEILKYEDSEFEFSFPMTVGQRYLGHVVDPAAISPPISPTRTGANVHLTVDLDAGAAIQNLTSTLHKVTVERHGTQKARVSLSNLDEIPNRDFILKYRVATDAVQGAFVTHVDPQRGGFFTLAVVPPRAPQADQIAAREVIFVIDQSGSQQGFPIEKSKELTLKMIGSLRPGDTFNVLGFANGALG